MIDLSPHVGERRVRSMKPLTWLVLWSGFPQNPGRQWEVVVCCARGHTSVLKHRVDALGAANPSVVCGCSSCDWHIYARLAGWSEPSRYQALLVAGIDEASARATCEALGESAP